MSAKPAPVTLAQRLRALPAADLVDRLITEARAVLDGEQRANETATTAAALAARHGRTSDVGSRDMTDHAQALAELVDAAGGALALSAGDVRRALAPAILDAVHAHELDPDKPYVRPALAPFLESAGIGMLPAVLPAGEAPRVVLHCTAHPVGQLLAALTSGDQDEVAAHADTLTAGGTR
ncbi:hypothetical protein [Streptomyces cinereoruber]|uniref:hypothetical protein n=1 Tax=Streptomyces cinereoruber TaxID=67260 RepID=UPI00362DAE3D